MSLVWPSEMGSWTWNGVSLIWAGGTPQNLEQMWTGPTLEQENHQQPGTDGLLPRDGFDGELQVSVDFHLSGLVLPNGDPAPNIGHGIAANYAELLARVGSPKTWPTRKGVETTVLRADGVTIGGLAQGTVSALGARLGSVGTATVSVTIPAGALEVTGS